MLARIAQEVAATPPRVALAWLLRKSPVTILIPGTSSIAHLEENLGARDVELSTAQVEELNRLGDAAV